MIILSSDYHYLLSRIVILPQENQSVLLFVTNFLVNMTLSHFQNEQIIKVNYLRYKVTLSSLTLLSYSCTGLLDTG